MGGREIRGRARARERTHLSATCCKQTGRREADAEVPRVYRRVGEQKCLCAMGTMLPGRAFREFSPFLLTAAAAAAADASPLPPYLLYSPLPPVFPRSRSASSPEPIRTIRLISRISERASERTDGTAFASFVPVHL